MTRNLLCGLYFFMAVLAGFAQDVLLPINPRLFPDKVLGAIEGLEKEHRLHASELAMRVKELWEGNRFSAEQKDTLDWVFDRLLGGQYRIFPDLVNYLLVVEFIGQQAQANRLFSAWHNSLAHSIQGQLPTRTSRFLQKSRDLFIENILYDSPAIRWIARNGNLVYDFRDNEPVVYVSGADLVGLAFNDSIVIFRTSGRMNFNEGKWVGKGGRLTWKRVLLDPSKVFAELNDYRIDLSRTMFEADSVLFYHSGLFEKPISGRVVERIQSDIKHGQASFPVFYSYRHRHEFQNIFPGVHFSGGFALHGSSIRGTGTSDQPARIVFYYDTLKQAKTESLNFFLNPTGIVSERASVTIYIENDSIWHPGLVVRYLNEPHELSALRTGGGISETPFLNTYHGILMYNEAIYWQLDTNYISFQMIRGVSQPREIRFESVDYFSQESFDRLQGINDIHPLSVLANFSRNLGRAEFSVNELSRHTRRPGHLIKREMINLQVDGFVSFFEGEDRILLMPKLFHYLAVNARRRDYDHISFYSHARVNARLFLKNNQLEINGVSHIPLSEPRNVVVFPNHQVVRMSQNRDFVFNGRVEAGFVTFFGREFYFNYNDFRLSVANSDSLILRVIPFENDQGRIRNLARVENILEGINGTMQIDRRDNRSGTKPLPEFPAFSSINEGFLFYEQGRGEVGAGTGEKFYFRIDPFTLKGLNNIAARDIAFSGSFVAKGVFPEINDYLIVQNDYTLGFSTTTPPGGIPIYDGLASFSGNISMDRRGIGITGTLLYQGSVLNTRELQIMPNEARGMVNHLTIPEGNLWNNPLVRGTNVSVSILPDQKSMSITTNGEPIMLYDGQASLDGNLNFDAAGLTGGGILKIDQASISAKDFTFYQNILVSNRSDLVARGKNGRATLSHQGFSAVVNMETGTGTFTPVDSQSAIKLDGLGISAPNYNYTWDLNSGWVEMSSLAAVNFPELSNLLDGELLDLDFSGNELIFTSSGKDSLKFFAPTAFYNVKTNRLNASGVPLIRVAGAAIFPHNQDISIDSDGAIAELEQARIIANTATKHHFFENASVNISSKNRFIAEGLYQYTDNEEFLNQIAFKNIRTDHLNRVVADAAIPDSIPFNLSDHFKFHGRISFNSEHEHLNFDGFSHIILACNDVPVDWFRTANPINPEKVRIRVGPETRNIDRRQVNIALMLAGDSLHVYPAFLTWRRLHLDREIISAQGYLWFNENTGEFVVTTLERLDSGAIHHNMISINSQTCLINAEGVVDLVADLGQLKLMNFGNVKHDPVKQTTEMNLAMGVDFYFTQNALEPLSGSLKNSGSPLLLVDQQRFRNLLSLNLNASDAAIFFNELQTSGSLSRLPPELNYTLFLSDVRMSWNQSLRSFISDGAIGLFSIEGNQIIRQVNGNLEVRKAREGDSFTLLLRGPDSSGNNLGTGWYFFHKQNNVMAVYSSVHEFNQAVSQLRPNVRRMQTPRGSTPYTFVLAYEQRPFNFFQRMRNIQDN